MTGCQSSVPVESRPALAVDNLSKSYSIGLFRRTRRVGVAGLSFAVERGEVFGYLGPNGSGKTTTLKILVGLLRPDAGRIAILGHSHDSPAWRYRTGFLPEHPYFYDYLTPLEYLDFVGRLFGMSAIERRERAEALLERLGLARARHVAVRRFSKGMVQRLGLAQALLNDPDLVFLDEPMSGLDPLGRHLVRDLILSLKRAGKTVFFSTHILSDAESLCDRVALLRAGRLLSVGRLDQILSMEIAHFEVLATGITGPAADRIGSETRRIERLAERVRIEVEESGLHDVLREVDGAGGRILSVQPIRQSLEKLFLKEMAAGEGESGWATGE
jgi:ABC-2 type transport system ATP-binding protein